MTRSNGINLALAGAGVLLYTLIFPPFDIAWLAFFALVPWLILIFRCGPREQFIFSMLTGLGFYLINVHWILPITIPGYISMSIYLALYWPVTGMLIRAMYRHGVPIVLTVPMAWVALEYIRGLGPLGFQWFYLGHSQADHLSLIQIADIGGAYAVSFMAALINAAIFELFHFRKSLSNRHKLIDFATAAAVLIATVFYGQWRLSQNMTRPGPVITVIQEDFPIFVEGESPDIYDVFDGHLQLSFRAIADHPDMIIWPETSIGVSINPEFLNAKPTKKNYQYEQPHSEVFVETLTKLARTARAYLIVGALSKEFNPEGHYPEVDKYNSAIIFDRQGNYADRYDKIRPVLFGEVVPFRHSIPWLYRFLNENMTPYGRDGFEYSLTQGRTLKQFTLPTDTGDYRYAIAICYEDTMADLVRENAATTTHKKPIDFLVNLSNDGWFNHSSELPQHLKICVFRAVENRLTIARSVNTGISGFINPDGSIEAVVRSGSKLYGSGIRGHLTRQIKIDSRITPYSRIKDSLSRVNLILVLFCSCLNPVRYLRTPKESISHHDA
ncbi:MAG: apolipoprotein N-acyltransferase [Phycisphaerae bacterium]|nr:apolipoprotein N-acyltransferase [Phycisphaerae bacterium]